MTTAWTLVSPCTIRHVLSIVYPATGVGILAMGMLFWGIGDGNGG